MEIEQIQITTKILYQGAIIFGLLDLVVISLLLRWVHFDVFVNMKWFLIITTLVVWFGIWQTVLSIFWEDVYSHLFPIFLRTWLPIIFGLLMSIASFFFWWVSIKFRRNPVIIFSSLAGIWGVTTHIWAIKRGILTKPPMLQGSSAAAALILAFFEYIFYFCIIVLIALLTSRSFPKLWSMLKRR